MSCAGWFIACSLNGPGQSPDRKRVHKSLTLFLAVAQRLLYRPPHGRQLVPGKARLGADGPGHVGLRRRLSICSHTQFLPFFRRSLPVARRALRSVFYASKRSPSGLRVRVTTVCAPPLSVAPARQLQRGGIARCPHRWVTDSQRSRHLFNAAMELGAGAAWDLNPHRGAAIDYVRNHMGRTVAAASYRIPPTDGASKAE